jgi:hypothetical protein
MKKFVKWMLTCDFNRVLATQNIGFTLIIASLIIATPIQFLRSWIPLAICMFFLVIGLVFWLLGMLWQEIRERTEDLWQNS